MTAEVDYRRPKCFVAVRLDRNQCSQRFALVPEVETSQAAPTHKFLIALKPSYATTHPLLVPQAVFAYAQDLFMFNSYVSSQARFQDPRYQAYCVDKFQKFLALQKDHPSVPLVPTACIDLVLQAYLIRPKKFQCELASLELALPTRTTGFAVPHKETLAITAALWTAKYGSSYDDSLTVPVDFVKPTQSIVDFNITMDIKMYQSFGVNEFNFFAVTNSQYAQLFVSHFENPDVVNLITSYAQDRQPGKELCAAYQKFLQWISFLARTQIVSADFVPVGLVDYIWHAHMLQHSAYCAFSKDLIGDLLVHEPGAPKREDGTFEAENRKRFCGLFHPFESPLSEQSHVANPEGPQDVCMYCGVNITPRHVDL